MHVVPRLDSFMIDVSKVRKESREFFALTCLTCTSLAAYGLVPSEERKFMHYQIGRRLVAGFSSDAVQDNIFDLANQLNFGIKILATSQERDDLARYNFLAGVKANKSTAFEAARKYLSIALDLLGAGGWTEQYTLMSQVTEAMVEVEYSLAYVCSPLFRSNW